MASYWGYYEKPEFELKNAGQINIQTTVGQEIFRLLQDECGKDIHTIVEIGTWNGRGSTMCILFGIQGRQIQSFHSIECNREKNLLAIDILENYIDTTIHILWGSIVNTDYIQSAEYRSHFPALEGSEKLASWFNIDIQNCQEAPNVLDQLPERIDFLLLDGGEYTTLSEFEILLPRCTRYIALDDTSIDKSRECRKRLLENPQWIEVYSTEERNGFSIFKYSPRRST